MRANVRTVLRMMTGCVALWLSVSGRPGSHSAVSSITRVDTRERLIAVSGRVVDAADRVPVSDAVVSVVGQTATTSSSGHFSFDGIPLSSGNALTVSKSGYVTHTESLMVPVGCSLYTVPDVRLQLLASTRPVVSKIESNLKGLFLHGVTVNNQFTISVNWNGLAPGHLVIWVNDMQAADMTGPGPTYSITLNMGKSPFRPSFDPFGNKITAQASAASGEESDPVNVYVSVLPLPEPLKFLIGESSLFTADLEGHLGVDFDLPQPPWKADLILPVLGRFGFEIAVNGSFDYTIPDGDWEVALGVGAEGKQGKRGRRSVFSGITRYPKMKVYVGKNEISGKIQAGARGTATPQKGITFDEIFGHGEIEAKLEAGRVGLLDVVPGLSSAAARVPGVGQATKGVSIIIYVIPGIEGDITFATKPEFSFDEFELTGKVGLEAAYEPKLTGDCELRVYVGGEPSVTFGYPGDLFRSIRFRAYAGAELKLWVFKVGPIEYVFIDVSYPSRQAAQLALRTVDGSAWIEAFRATTLGAETLQPISRDYLAAGPEQFTGSWVGLKSATGTERSLDDFRLLSHTVPKGSIMTEAESIGGSHQKLGLHGTDQHGSTPASVPSQVELTLVENAFPDSSPALASWTNDLMLLYVSDNGSPEALQFTDIRWTRWNGTSWSTPQTIHTNTQAEFSPQVAFDGNGDAIAVWERVASPDFNQTNLTAMAAEMEIVWSKLNRTNSTWSTPVPLTSNNVLDHGPLICGPMKDGNLLAVWTQNQHNLLMGTNSAGSQVLWAKWNPASQSWTAPQVLISDLPNRLSQSLSGVGYRAVYVWTRDMDGVLTDASDQQVFYCEWRDGAWGPVTQYTSDSAGNRNARVTVAQNGEAYLVWQRGTNLVWSTDFSGSFGEVRLGSDTAGFADYVLTAGPAGNLVLLWQEMSEAGSDAHYMVYDPASKTWSQDMLLCNDPPLERSFSPVWDNLGNLTVAYNKVEIVHTNKTVTLENGQTITITNVPQPGRVDLVVTKRALVRDLGMLAGDFAVQGQNYLPGDPLALSATVRNLGNIAVSNVVVSFFDGNPDFSGVLITNVTLEGWLVAGATNSAQATWIVPEPASPHRLWAVVNRAGMTAEFDESNNSLWADIGGTDLSVSLVRYTAESNGALRVVAQVQNLGAPASGEALVEIHRKGNTNAVLATAAVPGLQPGELAQVPLDLPVGTAPEGESLYTLYVTGQGAAGDVNAVNNSSTFAVTLWVDSDSDGMSDGWEREHGLDPADLADAASDLDGDGASNMAEYLAGTDPRDPASYLFVRTIAVNQDTGLVELQWGSAPNKLYTVLRSAKLPGGFEPVAQHIVSTPPENVFLHTNADPGQTGFYRLLVE